MVQLFKDTFQQWQKDDATTLAAALAYYAIFALGPLFTVLLGLASLFVGQDTASSGLMLQVRGSLGPGAAELLEQTMAKSGGGQTILGGLLLVVSASGLFAHLQKALNIIWKVEEDPDATWKDKLGQRLLSILMVFGGGLLLTFSLLASAVLTAWKGKMGGVLPLANELLTLLMTVVLFALLFKVLPDTEVAWRDVGIGALLTGCLFTLGKTLMGLYLGGAGQQFGGSMLLLLVWVYYSAQILFLGAEFTQVYARQNKDGSVETLPSLD
ncbi:MAG: YihY/virulence factor BrkB family protein [Candidatus Eremiobacteraeota bacterium]|nr:YihY/virulence factor BrkB family protein [Candidatus Eremiobacteraeota bacterium]